MGDGGFRRTKRAAAVAAVGVAATAALAAPGGAQQGEFNPGRGQAIAQAYRVNPKAGGLSLGITYGLALAGHQNTVGRAESQVLDMGIIGDTLAGEGCDGGEATISKDQLPSATSVDSREEGAEQGRTSEPEDEYNLGRESAKASATPSAEAVTEILPAGVPDVVSIAGGRTTTRSGVVDGNVREAVAITEIDRVDLGGQVVLSGLRWEAIHRSGATEELVGRFTIGGASIAGEPVEVPEQDPAAVLEPVNEALKPLGIVVREPSVRDAKGIQFVDPLVIGVVPAEERDSVLGPVASGVQPVREEAFGALLEQSCSFASPILIFDIVFGAFTGAGGLTLEVGGVQANTAEIAYSSALGGLPQGSLGSLGGQGTLASAGGSLGTSGAGSSLGGTTGAADAPAAESGGAGGAPVPAVPASSSSEGPRGGALAAVGAVGLAGIALTAEADRRRMRRSARTILSEA